MSLNFGAANSYVEFGAGGATALGNGAFTMLVLWKPNGNTGLLGGYLNPSTEQQSYLIDTTHLYGEGDFSSGFGAVTNGDWFWLGISKPAGAAHYRFHMQDHTTAGAWSHGESVGSGNHSDPGASDHLRVGAQSPATTASLGDVAVAAVWTSVLADATIEAAATAKLSDLIAQSPQWAARFMQSAPTNIPDLIGSGNETTRTGTITASADPPGYDFTLTPPGGPIALNVGFNLGASGTKIGEGSINLGLGESFGGLTDKKTGEGSITPALGLNLNVLGVGAGTTPGPGINFALSVIGLKPMGTPIDIVTGEPGQGLFVTPAKKLISQALRATFQANYPNTRLAGINVDIEYPYLEEQFPGIWVRFALHKLQASGLNPVVQTATELYTMWYFEGTFNLSIFALTSKERDLIADGLIEAYAFASSIPAASFFYSAITNSDLINMSLQQDILTPGGATESVGVPWDPDRLAYEDRYSFEVVGNVRSRPVAGATFTTLSSIQPFTSIDNVAGAPPQNTQIDNDGNGVWH